MKKIKQLLLCSKHQNTWEGTERTLTKIYLKGIYFLLSRNSWVLKLWNDVRWILKLEFESLGKLCQLVSFRWRAGSASNDSIRRPGIQEEKSGLEYSKPLQSLLFMNQVNLLKVKIQCNSVHFNNLKSDRVQASSLVGEPPVPKPILESAHLQPFSLLPMIPILALDLSYLALRILNPYL